MINCTWFGDCSLIIESEAWEAFIDECDRLERETQHRENMKRARAAAFDKSIAEYLQEVYG